MSYADFKVRTIDVTDGIKTLTCTPTTFSCDGPFTIMNVNMSGVTANEINASATNSSMSLGNNLISGNLTLSGNQTTGTVIIGPTKTITNRIRLPNNSYIEEVTGNSTYTPCYSKTFNNVKTTSISNVFVYQINVNSNSLGYYSKYFELIISGSNSYVGGYSYKFCFTLSCRGIPATFTLNNLTQLFGYTDYTSIDGYGNGPCTVGIDASVGNIAKISVGSPISAHPNREAGQKFTTTLIGYPTNDNNGDLIDLSIMAL
jgi:hypothetical protein